MPHCVPWHPKATKGPALKGRLIKGGHIRPASPPPNHNTPHRESTSLHQKIHSHLDMPRNVEEPPVLRPGSALGGVIIPPGTVEGRELHTAALEARYATDAAASTPPKWVERYHTIQRRRRRGVTLAGSSEQNIINYTNMLTYMVSSSKRLFQRPVQ